MPELTAPAGWTVRKVAELEHREPYGAHVVGWYVDRDGCSCQLVLGMRVDLQERTFGIKTCADHKDPVNRAFRTIRQMAPDDEPIVDLACRLVEREIANQPTKGER